MSMISRENAEALIQQQLFGVIVQDAPKASAFMSMAKRLQSMTAKQARMRVLDVLPVAYFVNGDTGFKKTSRQAWENVWIEAEECAVIVPIPEAVFDDADFDIFAEVNPRIVEAIGALVDGATFFNVNKPASWRMGIVQTALQAGNNVSVGDDLYTSLLGENGVFDKVESAGYSVTGAIARTGFKAKLRDIRDGAERPIFLSNMQQAPGYTLDGVPIQFPENGAFDSSYAQLIVGDWSKAVYSIRQDVTVKILTEGVIQDESTKEIVYNLAQQDMIALRVVFRMGWALPNPARRLDTDRITVPFAYLEPVSAFATQDVTFTVTDDAQTPAVVAGAYVEINGARKKTNASGVAVFKLAAGTYAAKIKKDGYTPASASATVASSAVAVAVTLPIA